MRLLIGFPLEASPSTIFLKTKLASSKMKEWAGIRQISSLSRPTRNTMSACSSLLNRTRPGVGADGPEAGADAELSFGAIGLGEDVMSLGLDSDETDDIVVAPEEEDDDEEVNCGEGDTEIY